MSTFLINSSIRKAVKKIKKNKKNFNSSSLNEIKKKIKFDLTNDQTKALEEITKDLKSNQKMFRLLQGDVGSGKTIVALITCLNVVKSNYQVGFMAPTEILARQHYDLAKNILGKTC